MRRSGNDREFAGAIFIVAAAVFVVAILVVLGGG